MIVESAKDMDNKECEKKTYKLTVTLQERYTYSIHLMRSLTNVVVLKYNDITFAVPNRQKDGYKEVVGFIINAILDDARQKPGFDEHHSTSHLELFSHDDKLLYKSPPYRTMTINNYIIGCLSFHCGLLPET